MKVPERAALLPSQKTCPFEGCGYSSTNCHTMKEHIAKHTGEKRNQCPHCSFRTAYKTHLTRHIKTVHLKLKPHHCNYCPYKATDRFGLRIHIANNHGKHYQC